MDEATFILLTADIRAQMSLIKEIFAKLEQRTTGLQPEDEVCLESVAYQLHNLYNAIEDLFKIVANYFENQINDTAHWHIQLLRRMQHDIPGVRPALVSHESYVLLNALRSFRHFF
jgi:hypothetical protein